MYDRSWTISLGYICHLVTFDVKPVAFYRSVFDNKFHIMIHINLITKSLKKNLKDEICLQCTNEQKTIPELHVFFISKAFFQPSLSIA